MLIKTTDLLCVALFVFIVSLPTSGIAECVSGDQPLDTKSIAIGGRDGEKLRDITASYISSIPEEMENIAEVDVLGPCGSFSHQLLFPKELEEDAFADMILGYRYLLEDDPNPEDILVIGLSPLAEGGDLKIRIYYENRAIDPPAIYRLKFHVLSTSGAADSRILAKFTSDEIDYLDSIHLLRRLRIDPKD